MLIQGQPAQGGRSWNGLSWSNEFPLKVHYLFLNEPCAHKMLRAASITLNNVTQWCKRKFGFIEHWTLRRKDQWVVFGR